MKESEIHKQYKRLTVILVGLGRGLFSDSFLGMSKQILLKMDHNMNIIWKAIVLVLKIESHYYTYDNLIFR